jgi:HAMP domain-containing protein/tetratricopeptide (TPR) repeat protein
MVKYKIFINDRNYSDFSFVDDDTNENVLINSENDLINVNPIGNKMFTKDVFLYENNVVTPIFSHIRTGISIAGILMLENNRTFGRSKNKKRPLYKCIPDDSHLPAFLIPYEIQMAFSKVQKNKYVLFKFENWEDKHPHGILIDTLGDVGNLDVFYEYQLHCKSLHISLSDFTKKTREQLQKKSQDEYIHQIVNNPNFHIEDRRDIHNIFSIDTIGSSDFDDAFSIEHLKEVNQYKISIYIANVYFWLEILGLWKSFSSRVSTIYLPDSRRPMLPSVLSDNLCSLQEGQSRFAFCMDIVLDETFAIKSIQYKNVVIKVNKNYRYEVGYLYIDYRIHTHKNAKFLFFLVLISTILILVIFPKFFRSSLVKPLNNLLDGVHSVNQGDLTIHVDVKVHDEIGFLAESFNSMVASIREARQELQDYASNLEDRVLERTTEVHQKMHEVNTLKVQQDGDYFLTSLLSRPLFVNLNKSNVVLTEFYISQKKKFEFRNKKSELGGDICVTDTIRLGTPKKNRNYIVALNGDAMGKSMQGAGGSLVMGVVLNSIIARATGEKMLNMTPVEWMTETYYECNSVFKSFNGTMILSAALALIDETNGDMYYWNAEHPFTVLYRDKEAGFIEDSLQLRKLGLDSEIPFRVRKYKLEPGDIVILASDGRDDIDLTPEDEVRTINEDENMFLGIVDKCEANIDRIIHSLREKGTITDDLSILRIEFKSNLKNEVVKATNYIPAEVEISTIEEAESTIEDKEYAIAVNYYKEGNLPRALDTFKKMVRNGNKDKNILRLCGLLAYKLQDYRLAEYNLFEYNRLYSKNYEVLHFLSLSRKKLDDYHGAINIGIDLLEMQPDNSMNYLYLADLYTLVGKEDISLELLTRASKMDPENLVIQDLLSKFVLN